MRRFDEEVIFGGITRFNVLPSKPLDTLNGTTPSVENCEAWKGSGNVVTITNFLDGADQQTILILGDGTTTISNNANIKTRTGANVLLGANLIYKFTLIENIWYAHA